MNLKVNNNPIINAVKIYIVSHKDTLLQKRNYCQQMHTNIIFMNNYHEGKLIYLSHTRPGIAFLVSVISQFMHAPQKPRLVALHRILRYLPLAPKYSHSLPKIVMDKVLD